MNTCSRIHRFLILRGAVAAVRFEEVAFLKKSFQFDIELVAVAVVVVVLFLALAVVVVALALADAAVALAAVALADAAAAVALADAPVQFEEAEFLKEFDQWVDCTSPDFVDGKLKIFPAILYLTYHPQKNEEK